jgi:hypothetical protein
MARNTYKFVWIDKAGKRQRKYLENESKELAVKDFEKTFKLSIEHDGVRVSRIHP